MKGELDVETVCVYAGSWEFASLERKLAENLIFPGQTAIYDINPEKRIFVLAGNFTRRKMNGEPRLLTSIDPEKRSKRWLSKLSIFAMEFERGSGNKLKRQTSDDSQSRCRFWRSFHGERTKGRKAENSFKVREWRMLSRFLETSAAHFSYFQFSLTFHSNGVKGNDEKGKTIERERERERKREEKGGKQNWRIGWTVLFNVVSREELKSTSPQRDSNVRE